MTKIKVDTLRERERERRVERHGQTEIVRQRHKKTEEWMDEQRYRQKYVLWGQKQKQQTHGVHLHRMWLALSSELEFEVTFTLEQRKNVDLGFC